ncbi:MAG: cytochrome family [Solirubrobacterales bacterium]|jgi:cytochrome P450|nr:cytochrome family [Solirubrobacterales bacterium]
MSALPPGPRMPRALQAIGWTQRPLPFLERCQRRFGDAFTLRIMHWGDWVILADPADVKKVFTGGDAVGVDIANPLLGPVLGPRSVMLLEEPEHMTRRKLMLPSFHGRSVAASAEAMAEVAHRAVAEWPVGEPFALWPRMQDITLDVVMRSVFGPDPEPRLAPLRERLRTLTTWMNEPRNLALLALAGPDRVAASRGYREAMEPVEEAVMEEVRRRRAEPDREDVVSMLVHARYEDGSTLSDRDLRDELVTLLSDGPTSTSLSWAFERMLRNPEVLGRAHADAIDGDGSYLDAVVKETLRLRPPVPVVVRRLLEPMRLAGYDLPAGTTVAPCIHLIHRSPAYYEQPRRFRPERFLEAPPGTYTWIPFGGGVRRCLAASFAEMEMKRVLSVVLSQVELRSAARRDERARRGAISFSPDQSGLVIAEPRVNGRPDRTSLAAA